MFPSMEVAVDKATEEKAEQAVKLLREINAAMKAEGKAAASRSMDEAILFVFDSMGWEDE